MTGHGIHFMTMFRDVHRACKVVLGGEWEDQGSTCLAEEIENGAEMPYHLYQGLGLSVGDVWQQLHTNPSTSTPADNSSASSSYLTSPSLKAANIHTLRSDLSNL